MSFTCDTCFDTETIDTKGTEVPCPDCLRPLVIKITGLGHGLGQYGYEYATFNSCNDSSITFVGTREAIKADVRNIRVRQEGRARQAGYRGRNFISSGAIAIEKRVLKALAA